MTLLHTLVAFIVALGLLIVVHEYGHFLIARLCGVKVLRFSVGFGRPLITKIAGKDRTEWVIAAIPFGGYVKMLDEREGPVEAHELPRAFNRQSVWRRFAIVIAGPLFNFAFAVLLYTGLFMHGIPEPTPVMGEPPAGSIAAGAGAHAGDTVRSVNGEPVTTWQDFRWRVLKAALQREAVQIETVNERGHVDTLTFDLRNFSTDEVEKDILERIGLVLHRPPLEPIIGRLESGPGQRAGLRAGDRITQVNEQPIKTWGEFVRVVQQNPAKELRVVVERDGKSIAMSITPEEDRRAGKTIGRVGVGARDVEKYFVQVSYGLGDSIVRAFDKTVEISLFSLKMLGKMLTGQVSWKHLSGPVTIADFAGQSAQMGLPYFLNFLALISISLGVLNLLPIPLLDGGHLMYYAIEVVKGKPVSERAMEMGQRVGLALLLVMMAFAFYNDLNRLLTG